MVFTDGIKIVIVDKNFEIHKVLEGIDCEDIQLVGSKGIVMSTVTKGGKLLMWNLGEIMNGKKEYEI